MKLFALITLTILLLSGQYADASNIRRGLDTKGKGGKGLMSKGKGKGGGKGKGAPTSTEVPSAAATITPPFDCTKACFTVKDLVTSMTIQVEAIENAQDVSTFYGYGSVDTASFNGPLETVADESMIMMHKDTTAGDNCNVGLVIVHDTALGPDATGQNSYANLTFTGDLTNALVKDDPLERIVYNENDGTSTVSWIWAPCCTDGMAHQYTLGDGDCITVTPDFVRGVDSWVFVGGDASNTRHGLNLANPIEICRSTCPLQEDS